MDNEKNDEMQRNLLRFEVEVVAAAEKSAVRFEMEFNKLWNGTSEEGILNIHRFSINRRTWHEHCIVKNQESASALTGMPRSVRRRRANGGSDARREHLRGHAQ